MSQKDLLPSRSEKVSEMLSSFIPSFFENNPISQLQLILLKDGEARIVTPLSGNMQQHIDAAKATTSPSGDAALKNALLLASSSLR